MRQDYVRSRAGVNEAYVNAVSSVDVVDGVECGGLGETALPALLAERLVHIAYILHGFGLEILKNRAALLLVAIDRILVKPLPVVVLPYGCQLCVTRFVQDST